MPAAWWEEFFSGLYLDLQRRAWSEEENERQADFLEEVLELEPGASVLDVPCGTGRLSLELSSRGYDVTGVDVTTLLDDARRSADELDLPVDFEERDMRDLPWRGEFDAAFCYWGSFGYFDERGNREFVESVSDALGKGGRFLVDTHVAETLLPRFEEKDWIEADDITALQERNYDHETGRIEEEWTLMQGDRVEKKQVSMRLYTYHELQALLEGAGFRDFEGYSSLEKEEFTLGSQRLYLVAAKG